MEKSAREAQQAQQRTGLQRRLHLAFGLLFISPVAGLVFFSIKYKLLDDGALPVFFLLLLLLALAAFGILNGVARRIAEMSERLKAGALTLSGPSSGSPTPETPHDELQSIAESFRVLHTQINHTTRQLEKKSIELSVLKDLSELCHITVDPEEILYITLERALLLTRSDLGSVLTLSRSEPKQFTVKATIGLGEYIKPGDLIDFETSIAKHAVVNRSPLVVEDIEKDKRFGRTNLSHYGTKSFVCLPIKTSNEIVGVLTLSSRDRQRLYGREEIDILTPLLANAAFTYENLRLMHENAGRARLMGAADKIAKLLQAGLRDGELLQAVLLELQSVVPFDRAVVLTRDETKPIAVKMMGILGPAPGALPKDESLMFNGSLVEPALAQDSEMMIDRAGSFSNELDRMLFAGLENRSSFLVPLRSRSSASGLLVLIGGRPHELASSQSLVRWTAAGLALALDRNRLQSAVIRRDREMVTIQQVGRALASSTFDMTKVLNYTLDLIREVLSVESGSIAFLKDRELELAVAFGDASNASTVAVRHPIGQGIAGYVAARGEAVVVNDTEKSPHFLCAADGESGKRPRTALCVPMISQGRVIGVIEVLNSRNGQFEGSDRDLLQAIAAFVCIALENARLYEETSASAEHERSVRRLFQKFVPKEIVEKIIHGHESGKPVPEELKSVTLLNIDIRGFSLLARRLGPRRMVDGLNRFFSAMGEIVFNHSGIVDKYLGDGFLSIFGAPVSTTEDADNALAAALQMRALLGERRPELGFEGDLGVTVGISIHTGEVVAGNIGFEKKMDFTVVGDPVNTVFRLQTLCKDLPNGIIVSEKTLQALRRDWNLETLPIAVPPELQADLCGLKVFRLP